MSRNPALAPATPRLRQISADDRSLLNEWATSRHALRGEQRAEAAKRIEACICEGQVKLDLSGLGLTELPNDIWEHCGHIMSLNLGHNRLHRLPDTMQSCKQLRSVDLSFNCFYSVPSQSTPWARLRHLDLGHNRIFDVPGDIFSRPCLEELSLNHNRLRALPTEVDRFSRLKFIDLRGLSIEVIPSEFRHLQSLCQVSLSESLFHPAAVKELREMRHAPQFIFHSDLNGLASSASSPGSVLLEEVRVWHPGLDVDRWTALSGEEGALHLAEMLDGLNHIAESRSAGSRWRLEQRVMSMLDRLAALTPDERRTIYGIAQSALESCEDQISVHFQQIEMTLIDLHAQSTNMTFGELVKVAKQCYRESLLLEIVKQHAQERNKADEVSIYLVFRRELIRRGVALAGGAEDVLYPDQAGVSAGEDSGHGSDVDAAEARLSALENSEEMRHHLEKFEPLRAYIRRTYATRFSDIAATFDKQVEGLVDTEAQTEPTSQESRLGWEDLSRRRELALDSLQNEMLSKEFVLSLT